ncbi:MAG: zinc ribbon domain-containing protein [Anaerolineae bacterium]
MSRAQSLYRLQSLDLEFEEKVGRLREVEAGLGESEALREARRALLAEEQRLAELQKRLRRQDLDLKTLSSKITAEEEKLYSGRIRNPKELAGIEEEVRYLKRYRSELEEEMLETMLDIEDVEAKVAAKGEKLRGIEAQWEQEQAHLREERAALQARLAELRAQRRALRASIASPDLLIYEELRRKKGGRGVALLVGELCQGCGVTLPTSQIQQARQSQDLAFCSNCGRILYVE